MIYTSVFFSLISTHSTSHSMTASGCSTDTSSDCTARNKSPPSIPLSFLYTLKFSGTISAHLIADYVGCFPSLMPFSQDSVPMIISGFA